ncbi:dephospho-CoA kinase [Asticcacaulis sp. AC402]|uniref:dephospho-CoA kinase n=1 Tax=Asticcacaulis sp. AC402 TaxID=1282361 RepID=UPI0003C41322|nr:dephospho-CoA kinase [Asticcacaulis sp. AC402]ESQ75886.1 dephospho-CoA kinase [Asticcacaulis sp. AC402]
MIKLGLTGSIGMGKSTIADMFEAEGVPVWDADEAVHRLYAQSEPLKAALTQAFGDVLTDHTVDRVKLLASLNGRFDALNALVHPATVADREDFLSRNAGAALVVADIPLLFETGAEATVDKVLVVSAPAQIQAERVLKRPGMTPEKFDSILSRQMPDAEKRRRADFVIDTAQSLETCREDVRKIILLLTSDS